MNSLLNPFRLLMLSAGLLFSLPVRAQQNDSVSIPSVVQENSLFTAEVSIAWVLTGGNPRPGGLHLGAGLNVARFFSKRMVLGLFAEAKLYKGPLEVFWNPAFQEVYDANNDTPLNQDFLSDLRSHLSNGIANEDGYSFIGNYAYRMGLQFSPFPNQYGGFLLRGYLGAYGFPLSGPFSGALEETEFLVLSLPVKWGMELVAKPFVNGKNPGKPWGKFKIRNRFIAGFFLEQYDWQRARFRGQSLSALLSSGFASQVANPVRFGIKAGIGFY